MKSVVLKMGIYSVNVLVLKAHISKNNEKAMAKAIQEKARSTFRSLLRRKISRWSVPMVKQTLPTNINAKYNKLINATIHYQLMLKQCFLVTLQQYPIYS
jgi:hypothetical protein